MGLAEPRKRTKISHDPNNTNWSRSTTNFGHKILTSQGWSPGDFLGRQNANHAGTFTSASASHIRVTLKDDNLGIGARPGGKSTEAEPTGLDAFQGLLGRLNGKSDTELEKDQRKRGDIKLALYAGNRWKTVNFIRGGLLVGDKPSPIDDSETKKSPDEKTSESDSSEKPKKRRKKEKTKDKALGHKKRPRSTPGSEVDISTTSSQPKMSRDKRSTSESNSGTPSEDQDSTRKRKSKSKSKSKKRKTREGSTDEMPAPDVSSTQVVTPVDAILGKADNSPSTKTTETTERMKEQRPAGRRFIRGRNIMQKKMALMDDRSLNEIFMVKS